MTYAASSRADGLQLESAGVRGGFPGSSEASGFHQAEGFVDWNLPWHWSWESGFHLQTRLDASLGWLGNASRDGGIATAGPGLTFGHERFPIVLEGGGNFTLLSRSDYRTKNFSEPLQFTTYLGLYADIASHWRIGYRFQHMSNAGLGNHNPGLNLHMIGLSYRF
jgi:hypothetical protein